MELRANCKINLGLDILRRRPDGYHDIVTVMYPVRELFDTVVLERTTAGGTLFSQSGLAVDCPDDRNLCVRACRLMRDRYGVDGLRIGLDKRVPFGAGLGGGSADATAVIMGIDSLFGLNLAEDELIECAAALGSDTAFFVRNEPQLCQGRGEVMSPVGLSLGGMWLVVAKPGDESVATAEAYAGVTPSVPDIPLAERLQRPVGEWQGSVVNAFERSVFAAHPRIERLVGSFSEQGALYASMSGSGAACFGIFADRTAAVSYRPPFGGVFVHCEQMR